MSEILEAVRELTVKYEKGQTDAAQKSAQEKIDLDRQFDEAKQHYTSLKAELDEIKKTQGRIAPLNSFEGGFKAMLQDALESMKDGLKGIAEGRIKSVGHAVDKDFMNKAVADMTTATHLVGNAARTFAPGITGPTYQTPHARNLLNVIPSQYDSYSWFQHVGGEGAIDWQSAEGAAKAQFDEDFKEMVVALRYLAGYMIVTRQLLRNIPGLLAYLTQWLPKKYLRAEDGKFYEFLSTHLGLTAFPTTGTNMERIITAMGAIAGAGYSPSAVLVNATAWSRIVLAKAATSGEYTHPPGIAITNNGDMSLFGVPMYAVSWVPDDKAIVGDFSYGSIIQSEAMSVRFSDEHGTILIQNKVLALVEASIAFALDSPAAFSFGDLGDVV
jgi:HK97 family phage major capsid protein